jgi:hypothetical protein
VRRAQKFKQALFRRIEKTNTRRRRQYWDFSAEVLGFFNTPPPLATQENKHPLFRRSEKTNTRRRRQYWNFSAELLDVSAALA